MTRYSPVYLMIFCCNIRSATLRMQRERREEMLRYKFSVKSVLPVLAGSFVIGCLAQVLVINPLDLPIQPCATCTRFTQPSQLDMFDNAPENAPNSVPDFSVNIPGFDSMNRPYIRDRRKDI